MSKTKNTRIAIAGIGGIGGYIGGKLAHYYSNVENPKVSGQVVEIVFIARGAMADAINNKGLCLVSKGISYTCLPHLTSDNPLEIGAIDLFIVCTKNFSVAGVLKKYASCITKNTTVITTQNTVSGKETIIPYLPTGATLMEGSIYIASNIVEPGKTEHISGPAKFIFGSDGEHNTKGEETAKFLNDAGIDATYTTDIKSVLWKKFMFVSPAAIVTALFKITFSEIPGNTKANYLFVNLISDLMQLAAAKNISIDDNTVLNNINLLANFKGEVKSSFQLDLEKNKPTEINSLVKYVVEEAKKNQLPTPYFDEALIQLTQEYKTLIE